MAGMTEKLTGQHVLDADLADWRLMVRALHAHFATGDFATGLRLAERIGAAAEEMNHHPDIDLRYPHVAVRLTSHDTGGVTERDVALARRISAAAAELGVAAEPSRVSLWELALDTADQDAIKPFWRAVLGYDAEPSAATRSTTRRPRARAWFQATEPHDEPRQRSTSTSGCRRRRPAADRRRAGRGRDHGQRRPGAVVLGARRRRRKQGVHLHGRTARSCVVLAPGRTGTCVGRQCPSSREAPVRWAGPAIGWPGEGRRESSRRGSAATRCHDVGPPSQYLGSVVDCLDAGTPRRRT